MVQLGAKLPRSPWTMKNWPIPLPPPPPLESSTPTASAVGALPVEYDHSRDYDIDHHSLRGGREA